MAQRPPLLQPDEWLIRAAVGRPVVQAIRVLNPRRPLPLKIGPFEPHHDKTPRCDVWRPHKGVAQERPRLTRRRPRGAGRHVRRLHWLMTPSTRIVESKALRTVTCQVMEAARARLVIGIA